MDATILTTFFCFILLVLSILALNELMILKRKVNAHLDRTDLHTDKLHTILSILQQIEAKQDLLFNNAPPAPGQEISEIHGEDHIWYNPKHLKTKEDAPGEAYWSEMHGIDSQPVATNSDFRCASISGLNPDMLGEPEIRTTKGKHSDLAKHALSRYQAKVSSTVPTQKIQDVVAKKRGRPKKAPND